MPFDFARSLSLAENRNYSQSIVRSAESRKASYVSGQLDHLEVCIGSAERSFPFRVQYFREQSKQDI